MRVLIPLGIAVFFVACGPTKDSATTVNRRVDQNAVVNDSVEYYETDVEVRQRNYFNQLQGRWVIDTMRRQARMQPDVLSNAWLQFNADSTFQAYAGCNQLRGRYDLKGTGIRFGSIAGTRMACPDDLEEMMLRLLQQTVSAYTIEGNRLMLRDGASNVVFSGSRDGTAVK